MHTIQCPFGFLLPSFNFLHSFNAFFFFFPCFLASFLFSFFFFFQYLGSFFCLSMLTLTFASSSCSSLTVEIFTDVHFRLFFQSKTLVCLSIDLSSIQLSLLFLTTCNHNDTLVIYERTAHFLNVTTI